MTDARMALIELLQKSEEGDFLRSVAEAVLQLLMEAEVEGLIGAARHERSPTGEAQEEAHSGSITATATATSPAARLIGTPRKRTISAREVGHGRSSEPVGARPGDAERPQESGAAAPGRGGRMSRQRKTAAVLRLLRGEDLETVSRELGVTAATLTGWRDAFLAAGEAALTTRAATGEELESDRLKAKLGAALIERDLLNEKIALLEANRPFARRRRKP